MLVTFHAKRQASRLCCEMRWHTPPHYPGQQNVQLNA